VDFEYTMINTVMNEMQTMFQNHTAVDLGLKGLHLISQELHWEVAPQYYRQNSDRGIEAYDSSIDPFRLHYIDPNDIVEITRREVPFFNNRWRMVGEVKNGNWDNRNTFCFSPHYDDHEWFTTLFPSIWYEDCLFHKSIIERYKNGKEWFDTKYIQAVLEQIERGNSVWHGCKSTEDVRKRCDYTDELYTSIQHEGYKTQKELGSDFKKSITQEVMVDIDRYGNPLFIDGRHRLSIAKVLGLNSIPVTIGVRHEQLFL